MKQIVVLIFLLLYFSCVYCQNILLVEKPGTVNNLKFRTGNRIELKTNNGEKYNGVINQIRDTAIIVDYQLIMNNDIKIIYTSRRLVSAFSYVGIEGGLGYIGIDAFNNLINNETLIFRNSTLKTGGIMFGIGILLKSISKRKRNINNESWRIKVLNFSVLKDPGIYKQSEIPSSQ